MGIYTFDKTPLNSHRPKINGIQWDYFNGKQWQTLPREFAKNRWISSKVSDGLNFFRRHLEGIAFSDDPNI